LRVVGVRTRRQVLDKLHHLRIRMHHCLHLSLVSPSPLLLAQRSTVWRLHRSRIRV
jgi:hypothetical protein